MENKHIIDKKNEIFNNGSKNSRTDYKCQHG